MPLSKLQRTITTTVTEELQVDGPELAKFRIDHADVKRILQR